VSCRLAYHADGFARAGDASGRAQIALTLLADALGDEVRAMAMHETFSRRVVALFPERWTISRTPSSPT
jgi:hypothetical protein